MSKYLQQIIDSPVGKRVLAAVGLPEPAELERFNTTRTSFLQGNVLVGAAAGSGLIKSLARTLKRAEVNLYHATDSTNRLAIEQSLSESQVSALPYQADSDKDLSFKALVFDASGIVDSEGLRALYEFFHPVVRRLSPCARVLVVSRPPAGAKNPHAATARRALEGFVRTLGKEIGRRGATANLVYVKNGAESQLTAPLQFLLSQKSAYVTGQVLTVSKATKVVEADWKLPLQGKVALVTGASRGIGEKIASVLARDGAEVVGVDIPTAESQLKAVMKRLGGKPLVIDISVVDAPRRLSDWIAQQYGGIDVVVHNAGITRDKTLGSMAEDQWESVININLVAQERINDMLLEKQLLRSGGSIVCVSSVSGIAGNFGQANYACSKAGVIGMVQAMAPILAERDITINAVAPGFIETQMTDAMPILVREVARRINALGQGGKPQDVAEAIAFFANPAARGVNGNVLRVCGQSMLGA